MTRKELENKMAVLLGGRAAERIVFGPPTGAADDLVKVTDIARAIVTRYADSQSYAVHGQRQKKAQLSATSMVANWSY